MKEDTLWEPENMQNLETERIEASHTLKNQTFIEVGII